MSTPLTVLEVEMLLEQIGYNNAFVARIPLGVTSRKPMYLKPQKYVAGYYPKEEILRWARDGEVFAIKSLRP